MGTALKKVILQADAYMVCLQHVLSTENFEVMGLLIGEHDNNVTNISSVTILSRVDKKKDRVEPSSNEMIKASSEAERLSKELNKTMRVVGWYHSHPHITVCPSHVDGRTQSNYQTMDPSFVGLIFSAFSEDVISKIQRVELICFQFENGDCKEIPLEIAHTSNISVRCCKTLITLPQILVQEEEDMSKSGKNHPDILVSAHNYAVRMQALSDITDTITKPLVQILSERIAYSKNCLSFLQEQINEMKQLSINQ